MPLRGRTSPSNALAVQPMAGSWLDPDDHGIGADEVFDAAIGEAGFAHPADAVGAGVVESARGLDDHVEAHQEAEGVLGATALSRTLELQNPNPVWRMRSGVTCMRSTYLRLGALVHRLGNRVRLEASAFRAPFLVAWRLGGFSNFGSQHGQAEEAKPRR